MIDNENLNYYLDKPVSALITLAPFPIAEGAKERHRLFSLLVMALVYHYWNGAKRGRAGDYPLNPKGEEGADKSVGKYFKHDYNGHNIAAIAVDGEGRIIDFEFNHNALFNSSAEHAEARLIRRVYSLTSVHDSWRVQSTTPKSRDDYNSFEEVTIYTSLESCAQCAGVMALARVKEVVYLQTDPSMYQIGAILRNLTLKTKLESPRPIPASSFDLPYFGELDNKFAQFKTDVSKTNPFFIPKDVSAKVDDSPSITSFLCTQRAYEVYRTAYNEFLTLVSGSQLLKYPSFKPANREGVELANALPNTDLLLELASFFTYAILNGKRATPHH